MPGGVCAKAIGMLEESAVRCAEVQVDIFGVKRRVYLGGVAKAGFPDLTQAQMGALLPGQALRVQWEAAVFHGNDGLLGPVTATLRNPDTVGAIPASEVRSLAATPADAAGAPPEGFFPAVSRNFFQWRFHLPRFGLVMDSQAPLINEATIDQIPPYRSVYQLVQPVELRSVRARSGRLARAVTALRGRSPTVVLESCRVKLMELAGVHLELRLVEEHVHSATFEMAVKNETTEPKVQLTWMVWPTPEDAVDGAMGVLRLDREPVTKRFSLPRDIFYRPRWLALAISEPFETEAAQAARFPPMLEGSRAST